MNPRSIDKQQAQELIKETFESPFDKSGFTNFIKNLLNRIDDAPFTYQGSYIPDAYKQYIKRLERIGKFNDGENNIDILVITLQKETSLERARTMQRNFIAWYLNGSRGGKLKEAALAAFVSPGKEDWRFSLVKMDYKFEQTKSGSMKVKEEFTPARRWSFLVGKNENSHTAQSRLVSMLADDKHNPTLKEIEKAFDIETVTKEFFLKYRELFLRTKEELDQVVKKDSKVEADFEAKGVDTVNFAKKLLGQIIFLYFLQKKGWFGVGRDNNWGTGSKHFLRELFEKKHGDYHNFFNDILEPLFYDALRNDRSHDDGYYSRFNCKIPFLNGGLFDPIGNYDWVHTDIIIPDKLFSNNVKTKEGDPGTGILDVFDRYNFTVKEDEPLEKEVAIDPELLGKSYEKFNAIRPDNYDEFKKALKSGRKGEENKFNKKFGVYYTPREIVHYMCQQSLINYLATELSDSHSSSTSRHSRESGNPVVSKEDIETLIHTGEQAGENEAIFLEKEQKIKNGEQKTTSIKSTLPESIRKNAKLLDDKLAEITVCDPAVGSGAFPVGMMSEILKARNVLTVFLNDKGRTAYNFKRQCIEHSLYGVDIDPGAVEIAKLRLWLSLVVDEEDIKNIKPLPNLDYKIMQGNSLIELLSAELLAGTIDHKRTELVKELKNAKDELFNITMPTQKENKRYEIDILMKKLFEYDRDSQIKKLKDDILAVKSQRRLFEDDKDKKDDEKKIREIESRIEEIKNIDVPVPTEHFEWHVNYSEIFQAKGGFDVVIANPPYLNFKMYSKIERSHFKVNFEAIYDGKADVYYFFIYLASEIAKKCGFICFITSRYWIEAEYAKKLRNYLSNNTTLYEIVDFKNAVVFIGQGIKTAISFFKKLSSNDYMFKYKEQPSNKSKSTNVLNFIKNEIHNSNIQRPNWLLGSPSYIYLIRKIELDSDLLSKYVDCKQGIVTGLDKAFIATDNSFENLPENIVKKWIKVGDIYKYAISPKENRKIVYTNLIENIDDYPELKKRVEIFKRRLSNRREAKNGKIRWFDLQWPRNQELFESEKLICRFKAAHNTFCYDNQGLYSSADTTLLILKDDYKSKINIKCLLALLNSSLLDFYFKSYAKLMDYRYEYYPGPVGSIRVNIPKEQKFLVTTVDCILAITKDEDYLQNTAKRSKVEALEAEIDQFVYKLYDLTPEEIKIVDGKH